MPDPAQPGTLRTLAKRAILCLLLGAVLQYLVAAAFGLGGTCGGAIHAWRLGVSDGDDIASLYVSEHSSVGRRVLQGRFLLLFDIVIRLADSPLLPDLAERASRSDHQLPDWSKAQWVNELPDIYPPVRTLIADFPPQPPSWSRVVAIRTDPGFDYYPQLDWGKCLEVACGWPMQSASYFSARPRGPGPCTVREGILVGNRVHADEETPRVIPLKIYWSGAIANTLLYAAALFVPFTLIPLTRRHLRRRAGRCVACGYDLRGAAHEVCPECGAAISPRAAT